MQLSVLRTVVMGVSVAGIVGMIVGSIADNNNGVVVTCGLVTAVGIVVLMAVAAATRPSAVAPPDSLDEVVAARVEARVETLVATGVDEQALRDLVGDAVRLGRSARRAVPPPRPEQ